MRNDILLQGLEYMPAKYTSIPARAMLLAIAKQESDFQYRIQMGKDDLQWWHSSGPARGYWQFEKNGIKGVLSHHATGNDLFPLLAMLDYPRDAYVIYDAIAYDTVLACIMARMLLWTYPAQLPHQNDPEYGWKQYMELWRPGKPHKDKWDESWAFGWRSA